MSLYIFQHRLTQLFTYEVPIYNTMLYLLLRHLVIILHIIIPNKIKITVFVYTVTLYNNIQHKVSQYHFYTWRFLSFIVYYYTALHITSLFLERVPIYFKGQY